jgi:hypothetical protein
LKRAQGFGSSSDDSTTSRCAADGLEAAMLPRGRRFWVRLRKNFRQLSRAGGVMLVVMTG